MENRIAISRRALGFSQQQLADRVGVSPATLAAWEAGQLTLSVEDMVSIANELQLPIDFLLCRDSVDLRKEND